MARTEHLHPERDPGLDPREQSKDAPFDFQTYFRSSIRAIARLCTSSGPSTMRMTRERAQA